MSERVQKVLARAGYGSRREIEGWIKAGRLKINDKLAKPGDQIDDKDKVSLDGKPLRQKNLTQKIETRVLAYNKPVGEVCTRKDPQGRPTVYKKLPRIKPGRWISIGRLDINSSGLLLFTNDGELANGLMHPSSIIDREYAVRVLGTATDEQLKRLRTGVELDDGVAKFTDIVDSGGDGANHWYHVVVMEGRNREVRRLWESQNLKVSRLTRVRYGPYILERKYRAGKVWELDKKDVEALQKAAHLI